MFPRRPQGGSPATDHPGVALAPDTERVRLTVPGLGGVNALVARAVPGAAELVFEGEPPAPARVLHRRSARMSSLPPSPPAELVATLLAVPDARGALRPDVIHALLEQPDIELVSPARRDRRTDARVTVLRAVSIHHPGEATGIRARTEDVSLQGVGLRGAAELARGDLVRLRILLDDQRVLHAVGEVRRRTGHDGHGVQLVRMRPQDRTWLQRWLTAQRAAALAALGA
ncbi:MAG: PilZ protein [Solirubrobacterales bacterium]|nr:PilZ protein [Solirubrobacterales bacterium]